MHDDDESRVTGPLDGGDPAAQEWTSSDFSGFYDTAVTPDPSVQGWVNGLPDASGEFTGTFDAVPCSVCGGCGLVGAEWLYQRAPSCTCGAIPDDADWGDFLTTIHASECDSVPCPFCALEAQ